MPIMNFGQMQIDFPVAFYTVNEMIFGQGANTHGHLQLKGILESSVGMSAVRDSLENMEICVSSIKEEDTKLIFYGIIDKFIIKESNQLFYFELMANSGTIKLDRQPKSRSFQDVSMSYSDVVKAVLKDTLGAAAIFSIGKDKKIGKPLIQYQETDWEFFKRLASHFSSGLIPNCHSTKPQFWFGMRENGENRVFEETEYCVAIEDKFYKMGGNTNGYKKKMFLSYSVKGENCRVGDTANFHQLPLMVCRQNAFFKNGELFFNSILADHGYIGEYEYYNEKITGLSLEGTVKKTNREVVQLHLDIDKDRDETKYFYEWIPNSGNLMYLMPEVGTKVSLYFADHDERNAKAINSPRRNGQNCSEISNYNNRYLTTKHNKRMFLFPKSMGFVGTGKIKYPLKVILEDKKRMLLSSHKKFEIFAQGPIRVKAPHIRIRAPKKISTLQTSTQIENKKQEIVPKGTGH